MAWARGGEGEHAAVDVGDVLAGADFGVQGILDLGDAFPREEEDGFLDG